MIRFACPACQSHLKSPDDKAGAKIACPKCGQKVRVPEPPDSGTVLGVPLPPSAFSSIDTDGYTRRAPSGAGRGPNTWYVRSALGFLACLIASGVVAATVVSLSRPS